MSKEYIIKDDVYLTLLKYFKGDLLYLNPEILKILKKVFLRTNQLEKLTKVY